MAATVPHINIYDSFLHHFDFTPRVSSDLDITITRVEEASYILQYRKNHTFEKAYRLSRTPDQWKVEQVQLSPTTFVHDCHVYAIDKTQTLNDQRNLLPHMPIPLYHSFVQGAGVVVIGIAGYGARAQFQNRQTFLGVVFVVMGFAYMLMILAFRQRSKQIAFDLAERLIGVVDIADRLGNLAADSTKTAYLSHSRDQYK